MRPSKWPRSCARCADSLADAAETARIRHQVVDADSPPPPTVTEYRLISRRCGRCGQVNDLTATDVPRPVDPGSGLPCQVSGPASEAPEPATAPADPGVAPDTGLALVLRPGRPVRTGPRISALAALLTCGNYLPIGRAASLEENGCTIIDPCLHTAHSVVGRVGSLNLGRTQATAGGS